MRSSIRALLALAVVVVATMMTVSCVSAASLFQEHEAHSEISLNVNSLTSRTGVVPYSFYRTNICKPDAAQMKELRKGVERENIGAKLWGNRVDPSIFKVHVLENSPITVACEFPYSGKDFKQMKMFIRNNYFGHFILDGLPAIYAASEDDAERIATNESAFVVKGFPLGTLYNDGTMSINNHFSFTVQVVVDRLEQSDKDDVAEIIGFFVTPYSLKTQPTNMDDLSKNSEPMFLTDNTPVKFTYSVSWVRYTVNEMDPANRWLLYMRVGERVKRDHWLTIINSLLLLIFSTLVVIMIMVRTVRKDLLVYADPEEIAEAQEESGWKLLQGDVFRPPENALLLAAVIGTGCQVLLMFSLTVLIAWMSKSMRRTRGSFLSTLLFLFFFTSGVAGYISARMLKLFKKQSWKNGIVAVLLVPAMFFMLYLTLNLVQWGKHASSAIPFGTLFLLFCMWGFFFLPLATLGVAVGFRQGVLTVPVKTSAIPRPVPEDKIFMDISTLTFCGGLLPFSAAFIEIVYVLSAFWQGQPYQLFGFLAVICMIVLATCADVSIVLTYVLLSAENYNWWWFSFNAAASSGVYFFIYCVFYFFFSLTIRQMSGMILYFGYSFLASLVMALLTGTVGFVASAIFVRAIYSAIKVD